MQPKRIFFVPVAVLASTLMVTAGAFADGAVAVGIPPAGVANGGFAWGRSTNNPSVEIASTLAMSECRAAKGSNDEARKACQLMMSFSNQCVALAMDPYDSTPGVGWAVAPQKEVAESDALANCRKTAGAGREQACVISDVNCDTKR